MPWKIQGNCVHKENADGSVGEMVKCHDTPEQAQAHMKALYANEPEAEESASPAKLRASDLHDFTELAEAVVDADRRLVDVTLIAAGWSKNGRYYPADVLSASAAMWHGVKAYADHPTRSAAKDRPERSVLEAVGVYEHPRFEEGKVKATFRPIGRLGDDLWPWVLESVQGAHKPMGLSIHALGQTRIGEAEGRKGPIVESITHANSVDFVTSPAAGGGFDRLLASDDGGWTTAVLQTISIDELREARPDLIDGLKREWKTTRDTQALEAARAENDELRRQLDAAHTADGMKDQETQTLRAALREAQVDRLLDRASELPDPWRTSLRSDLLSAEESAWAGIVERERQKLAAVRGKVPVTGAGRLSPRLEPPAAPLPTRSALVEDADLSYSEWLARRKPQ